MEITRSGNDTNPSASSKNEESDTGGTVTAISESHSKCHRIAGNPENNDSTLHTVKLIQQEVVHSVNDD